MLDLSTLKVGSPVTWRTTVYGDIAVHIDGFSPNGQVAILRIVGGEDSTPANRFPELSDGNGFATAEQLVKRTRQASARKVAAVVDPVPEKVIRKRRGKAGMIRAQAEIGKPAAKLPQLPSAGQVRNSDREGCSRACGIHE